MTKILNIAVDAMGGDGSPKKTIDGIIHHSENTKNINLTWAVLDIKRLIKQYTNNVYAIVTHNNKIILLKILKNEIIESDKNLYVSFYNNKSLKFIDYNDIFITPNKYLDNKENFVFGV